MTRVEMKLGLIWLVFLGLISGSVLGAAIIAIIHIKLNGFETPTLYFAITMLGINFLLGLVGDMLFRKLFKMIDENIKDD